jgi:muconolactone D-isomerase
VEFLVQIEVELPDGMIDDERDELIARERVRGRELLEEGVLAAIWRIPGRFANVGIWRAADATELDDALASLPLRPWLDVEVTPLAAHPLTRDRPSPA